MLSLRRSRRFYAIYKRNLRLILLFLTVLIPIVVLLLQATQLLYRKDSIHIAKSNYFHKTADVETDPPRRQNAGEILSSRVQKFSRFIVELNNSDAQQFDSGVLNFTYKSGHMHALKTFLEEFSGYDSFPTSQTSSKYRGYIYTMGVGQELSQCTRHLLELCLYAATSNRKCVTPQMRNGAMKIGGQPFGEFFNVSRLNKQLQRFGYSELASDEEFWTNCDGERKTVLVVFYEKPVKKGSLQFFAPDDKLGMYERVKKHGWLNCTKEIVKVPKMFKKYENNTDYYCLEPNLFGNLKTINDKILGDSKCVFITQWNEQYKVNWRKITRDGAPGAFKMLYWFLDPSLEIINEARAFQEERIERPYVAIHIRGAKFKNQSFLRPCFDIALEFVNALRRTRKVKTLFLSTDMSKFGGVTNKDKNSHQLFADVSGAVIYDPEVTKMLKGRDRWKVSLTEVRLLSQSDHLITIGQGSFGGFIRNRYFWEHRDKQNWTLSTICMKTATRFV